MMVIGFVIGTIVGITVMAITSMSHYDKGFYDGYSKRMFEDHLEDFKRSE